MADREAPAAKRRRRRFVPQRQSLLAGGFSGAEGGGGPEENSEREETEARRRTRRAVASRRAAPSSESLPAAKEGSLQEEKSQTAKEQTVPSAPETAAPDSESERCATDGGLCDGGGLSQACRCCFSLERKGVCLCLARKTRPRAERRRTLRARGSGEPASVPQGEGPLPSRFPALHSKDPESLASQTDRREEREKSRGASRAPTQPRRRTEKAAVWSETDEIWLFLSRVRSGLLEPLLGVPALRRIAIASSTCASRFSDDLVVCLRGPGGGLSSINALTCAASPSPPLVKALTKSSASAFPQN